MFADKPTLKSLIEDLTGVPVTFDPAEPRPHVNPLIKAQIFVQVKGSSSLGVDDFPHVFDGGQDKNIVTQSGNRLFTLSVKMESYIATVNAYETLEILRTKMFRPSSLQRLRDGGNMTAATAAAVVDLPTEYDHRVISVAVLDVHMALRFSEVDDTNDGNWIETYDLSYAP